MHVGWQAAQDGDALYDAAHAARSETRLTAFGQAAQLQIDEERRSIEMAVSPPAAARRAERSAR